jgi:hypothetical protein
MTFFQEGQKFPLSWKSYRYNLMVLALPCRLQAKERRKRGDNGKVGTSMTWKGDETIVTVYDKSSS